MKIALKKTLHRELFVLFLALIIITTSLTTGCAGLVPGVGGGATEISEKPVPSKNVAIHYAVTYQDTIGTTFQASPGETHLILDMDIRNNGYKSVDTNPMFFLLSYNGTEYHSEMVAVENYMQPMALADAASASGSLVFQIPKSKIDSSFEIIYQPFIGTMTKYNIISSEKQ